MCDLSVRETNLFADSALRTDFSGNVKGYDFVIIARDPDNSDSYLIITGLKSSVANVKVVPKGGHLGVTYKKMGSLSFLKIGYRQRGTYVGCSKAKRKLYQMVNFEREVPN